jgi:hypothetical protein
MHDDVWLADRVQVDAVDPGRQHPHPVGRQHPVGHPLERVQHLAARDVPDEHPLGRAIDRRAVPEDLRARRVGGKHRRIARDPARRHRVRGRVRDPPPARIVDHDRATARVETLDLGILAGHVQQLGVRSDLHDPHRMPSATSSASERPRIRRIV